MNSVGKSLCLYAEVSKASKGFDTFPRLFEYPLSCSVFFFKFYLDLFLLSV